MPEQFEVKIDGIDDFVRRLDRVIDRRTQRSIMRKSLRTATRPVKTAMRRAIRRQGAIVTKTLVRRISEKVALYESGAVVALVGPRRGRVGLIQPTRYAHLVDKGTKPHRQSKSYFLDKKTGLWKQLSGGFNHPGAKPKPFLNVSAKEANRAINDIFTKRFNTLLTAALKGQSF